MIRQGLGCRQRWRAFLLTSYPGRQSHNLTYTGNDPPLDFELDRDHLAKVSPGLFLWMSGWPERGRELLPRGQCRSHCQWDIQTESVAIQVCLSGERSDRDRHPLPATSQSAMQNKEVASTIRSSFPEQLRVLITPHVPHAHPRTNYLSEHTTFKIYSDSAPTQYQHIYLNWKIESWFFCW